MTPRYRSWLKLAFERFVMIKRAGGAQFESQSAILRRFDAYLARHAPSPPLRRSTVLACLADLERLSPRGRDNFVEVVWGALDFARNHGAQIETMPPRPPRAPPNFRLRPPRLVTERQIARVIKLARGLPLVRKTHALRPATYATLFGLLFATGIRIGEALALDVGSLDPKARLLTIERGKFGKSRVLPVRSSTADALQRYVLDPRRRAARSKTSPLFVSSRGRLSHPSACHTWRSLCSTAGISNPTPRLHDIRHSFAVLRVMSWYRAQRDVNAWLPALSTYLGHVSVENTWVYLRENGSLLREACDRFSIKAGVLDEVLP